MDEIFDFSMLETMPDADAEIVVPDEVLEGPQTEEEQGVANLILDAISNSANTIQMYNAIIANCTDEEIVDSLNEILVDENRIMGKLQSILQKVSPNAEEIMNGAIEDSGLEESLNENVYKEWKPNTSFKHIKSVLDTALARGKYVNNEREEVLAALDKADKGGYTPEQRKFIKDKHREMWKKNRTVESFVLDESNNLDTALNDVTPVRDVHNERAIRDHKKSRELRKNAIKEISKNVKDVFELDESLNL